MRTLTIAAGLIMILLALIIGGLITGNPGLSSLTCLFAWSPGVFFLGYSFRGAGLRVSVSSSSSSAPAPEERPVKLERRMRTIQ